MQEQENNYAKTTSPSRKTTQHVDFYTALKATIGGSRITREEWGDTAIVGYLNKHLMIRLKNGDHQWILVEEDILAEDWIILN